jgi:hypothetical protein
MGVRFALLFSPSEPSKAKPGMLDLFRPFKKLFTIMVVYHTINHEEIYDGTESRAINLHFNSLILRPDIPIHRRSPFNQAIARLNPKGVHQVCPRALGRQLSIGLKYPIIDHQMLLKCTHFIRVAEIFAPEDRYPTLSIFIEGFFVPLSNTFFDSLSLAILLIGPSCWLSDESRLCLRG